METWSGRAGAQSRTGRVFELKLLLHLEGAQVEWKITWL